MTISTPIQGNTPTNDITLPKNKRINLSTDLRNVHSEGHLADLITLQSLNDYAKATLAFKDKDGNDVGWLQAHNYLDEELQNQHKHMSLEASDDEGQMQTRIDIPYGADHVEIKITSADFTIGSGGDFKVTDGTSTFGGGNVSIDPASGNALFNVDRPTTSNFGAVQWRTDGNLRWAVRQTNDSTDNLYIRNATNGINAFKFVHGAGMATRVIQRAPNTATTDANLGNNEMEMRLDEGNDNIIIRVKYSDGTLGTATLAVTKDE